jgi:hypothetical protein
MVLKDILSISGQPGLFKFIAQGKNAIVVEHLETKKRSSAFGSAKVSSLEEISVFTENEDLPLGKVFDLIYEKEDGGPAISHKSEPEKLTTWFEAVVPEYDRERVYNSDIKKIIQWYNILHSLKLLEPDKPEEKEKEGTEESKPEKKPAAKKSAPKKSAPKKSAPKKNPPRKKPSGTKKAD